ncbi:Sensor histidine kinase RcsC [BD1-7 clade bacterium]|uniref:histidine kinase n=1 Tax=BD1-7 clade bacterium TaxID=2029982 RepID=A0A5S9QNT2_9GAMM|nr:Sensor histidine kinase RcsC [BD1-7 clade bacterium]CAA0120921.1 Sensor histidine kinase RcsC [BD1-7 clade bacterium]
MSLLSRPIHVAGFAVLLTLSAAAGLYMSAGGQTPAFWPASGIACSYFVFSHRRLWLWYSLGFVPALAAPFMLMTDHNLQVIAVLVSAGLLQALVAGFLVQSQYPDGFEPRRLRVLLNFLLITSVIAPFFSGFFGTSAFYLAFGNQTWLGYFVLWVTSNGSGILTVIVPFYFLAKGRSTYLSFNYRITPLEIISYTLVLFFICHWIATIEPEQTLLSRVSYLLLLPALLFASIRYNMFTSAMSCLYFAVYTANCMHMGVSPFAHDGHPVIENVLTFDLFLYVLTLTTLTMGAMRHESALVQVHLREQKNLIESLNQKKSAFIQAINDKLRAPVTQVVGSVDRLKDSELTDYQRSMVESINVSSHKIMSLIDDILSFSKAENAHLHKETVEFSLERILHNVVQSFGLKAETKGVGIYLLMENAGGRYRSDPTLIKQIVTNLLNIMLLQSRMSHILIKSRQTSYCLMISFELTGKYTISDVSNSVTSKANISNDSETLGIFISQKLTEALNGKLTFTDHGERGVGFYELELPMIPVIAPDPVYERDYRLTIVSSCQLEASLIARSIAGRVKTTALFDTNDIATASEDLIIAGKKEVCILDWRDTNVHKCRSSLLRLEKHCDQVIAIVPWSMDISGLAAFNILTRPYSQTELITLINDAYHSRTDRLSLEPMS